MTSGIFHLVPLADISVRRDDRQRRELTDIDVLADSIRRLGLIHPIVVTRDLEVVAGERRTVACRQLGWFNIPVQYVDELDPATLQAIELEENIKRKDIDWRDQCRAVHNYHLMRARENPYWSHGDTGQAIGLSKQQIGTYLSVAKELISGNPMVSAAP